MHRLRMVLLVLLIPALFAAACTGAEPGAAPATSAPAVEADFPATVPTAFGDVVVERAPSRVVALGWGDAETALALGVQPVGASDWLGFGGEGVGPWAAGRYESAPEIIGTTEPSYEAIAALKPDLILDTKSSGDQRRHELLSAIAPTVGVPTGGTSYLTTTEQQMTMIATALGKTSEAADLLSEVDAAFTAAREAHPEWQGKTVTAATKTAESWGAYIKGSERVTFLENLGFVQNPKIAELDSSATGFSVTVSSEQLTLLDADLIVAFPIFVETSQLSTDRVFQAVPAVADGRSVIIDGDLAAAYSLGTTLALDYAIEKMVPLLEQATR